VSSVSAPLKQVPDAPGSLLALRPKLADGIQAYYEALLRLRNPQMPGRERRPLREIHIAERVRKITSLSGGSTRAETEAEVPWEAEWRNFPHRTSSTVGGGHLWHLVLGEPGSGKSTLTNHAVLQLTDEGLERLKQQRTLLEELPVPVWIDLRRFIQDAVPKEGVIGPILEALLRQLQSGSTQAPVTAGPELTGWLERALLAGRAWLFLDGLDRVTRRDHEDWLRPLADLHCPTIITCRLRDFERLKLPARVVVREYWLAKFGRTEQTAFVDKWFERERQADKLKGEQRANELKLELDRSPRLRATCSTPLLLALACLVKSDNTGVGPAESKIYEAALRHLLMPEPEAAGGGEPTSGNHRSEQLFGLLTRIAPPLFDLAKGSNLFFSSAARTLIAEDDKRPSARGENDEQKAQSIIDELIAAGVLIAIDSTAGTAPQLSFLHATLLEFLVAQSLWEQRLQGLTPTLRDELVGLARPERREVMRLFVDLRNTASSVSAESVDAADFLKLRLAFASSLDALVPPKGAGMPVAELTQLKSILVDTAVREWARQERVALPLFAERGPPVAAREAARARRPRLAWLILAGVGLTAATLAIDRAVLSSAPRPLSVPPPAAGGSASRSDSPAFDLAPTSPSSPAAAVSSPVQNPARASGSGGKKPKQPPGDARAQGTPVDAGAASPAHAQVVSDAIEELLVPPVDSASDAKRNTSSARTDLTQ
jgi:hypothetical protein